MKKHIFPLTNIVQITDNNCMVNKTESTVTSRSERPLIKASCGLWDKFDVWMSSHGYQTIPEGLRAAMIKVTGFDPESQAKIT